LKNVQLFQPSDEGMRGSIGIFLVLRAFGFVQDFGALVDSWPNLLLAQSSVHPRDRG
jgi:hypothetical protein